MSHESTDRTGAPVTIAIGSEGPIKHYVLSVDGSVNVGRVEFIDVGEERIFFHTEIDNAFGDRGLARILLRKALDDSIRDHLTVVPVCPFFAHQLNTNGDEFRAQGGLFRQPTSADISRLSRTLRRNA